MAASNAHGQEHSLTTCVACHGTLSEPVLLDCLHNACSTCITSINETTTNGLTALKCPRCLEPDSLHRKKNTYVASVLSRFPDIRKESLCQGCLKRTGTDVVAHHYCISCPTFLCEKCFGEHEIFLAKHHVIQVDENYSITTQVPAVQPTYCPDHGERFTFYCSKCFTVKCTRCLVTCEKQEHSYYLIDGRYEKLKQKINAAIAKASAGIGSLHNMQGITVQIESLQRECATLLDANKKAIIDFATKSHEDAKLVLHEYIDSLNSQHSEALRAVVKWQEKFDHCSIYAQSLVVSQDAVSLVDQHHTILSRLQRLNTDALSIPASLQSDKKLVIEIQQPPIIEEIVKKFIGLPLVIAGSKTSLSNCQKTPEIRQQPHMPDTNEMLLNSLPQWLEEWEKAKLDIYEEEFKKKAIGCFPGEERSSWLETKFNAEAQLFTKWKGEMEYHNRNGTETKQSIPKNILLQHLRMELEEARAYLNGRYANNYLMAGDRTALPKSRLEAIAKWMREWEAITTFICQNDGRQLASLLQATLPTPPQTQKQPRNQSKSIRQKAMGLQICLQVYQDQFQNWDDRLKELPQLQERLKQIMKYVADIVDTRYFLF